MNLEEFLTIEEEEKYQFKSVNLIRWGGLSATPHDVHYKERKDYFHTPPSKSGIFCFLNGYVEPHLFDWKLKDEDGKKKQGSHLKKRNFSYRGKIWTHIKVSNPEIKYYNQKGTWHETDSDSLEKIFKKDKAPKGDKNIHYELFIERKHLGGI